MKFISLVLFTIFGFINACKETNIRPIVGILTQFESDENAIATSDSKSEMIAASYVKYLEAAGARVVPIRITSSKEEIESLFHSINGVLIPGGSATLRPGHKFFDTSELLFKLALEANKKGDIFPIWGTCLGFETLAILGANSNSSVLFDSGSFDSHDYPAPINLNGKFYQSELFSEMPGHLLRAIQVENITYNSHSQGISPTIFEQNPDLNSFYHDLATYTDKKGKPFVAIIEAKQNIPIFGIQFHPEKSLFEWIPTKNIPHQVHAIQLAQYFANLFVSKARCNNHHFPGGYHEESSRIIEKSCARHVVQPLEYFSEIYKF